MKQFLKSIFAALLFVMIVNAQHLTPALQSPSYQTPQGYNAIYTLAMTDSTGTHYSPAFNTQGYLPQDIYTNYIPCYVVGTGTADSVDVLIQTRMETANNTFTVWTTADSVKAQFNKVDGIAYYYPVNFNGAHPDQFRFVIAGKSTVNRSDVVITAIAVLTRQLPTAVFQIR